MDWIKYDRDSSDTLNTIVESLYNFILGLIELIFPDDGVFTDMNLF